LASRITYEDRWLQLRSDRCQTIEGAIIDPYHVIESADWVNVVALRRDRRLLLAREYQHGCGEVVTGLVGGVIEPADISAEAAARRELLEETGYGGGTFTQILTCYANATRQNNAVTSFLAVDVELLAEPRLDPGGAEAVEIVEDDLPAVLSRLCRGELRMSAMHVAALWSAAAAILTTGIPAAADLRERIGAMLTPLQHGHWTAPPLQTQGQQDDR
jgi:ADP-ribose pyrophosphatase YjhB (NUDIX family)